VPSQSDDLIDPHTALSEALDALTTGFLNATPRPETGKSGHNSPGCLRPFGLAHSPCCTLGLGHIIAFSDAMRAVLRLHSPRKASDPGVPSRCRHDNNTWPCKTFTSVASALDGVLIDLVDLNANVQPRTGTIADRVRSGPGPASREYRDYRTRESARPYGRRPQGRRSLWGGTGLPALKRG
jgi:hypothetical protein